MDRIDRARAYVAIYRLHTNNLNDEDQSMLGDVLADLRHWAEAEGLDFEAAVTMSWMHWDAERDDTERGDVTTPTGSGDPADEDQALLASVFGDAIEYRIPEGESDEPEDHEIAESYYSLAERLGVTPTA